LGKLGTERAWVVNGSDGLDEITTTGSTWVAEWTGSEVKEFEISPTEVGLALATDSDIKGGDPAENAVILRDILGGVKGPKRDIVVFNAAAALFVCGKAESLQAGIALAQSSIDSGAALKTLDALIALSKEFRP